MMDDWDPPPGMIKRQCANCRRSFATRERIAFCPTCQSGGRRRGGRDVQVIAGSVFDSPATNDAIASSARASRLRKV